MSDFEFYEEHKEELIKFLVDLGYTPHTIVEEASNDDVRVFTYIKMLYEISQ